MWFQSGDVFDRFCTLALTTLHSRLTGTPCGQLSTGPRQNRGTWRGLVLVVTDADAALIGQTVSPIPTDLNVCLRDAAVADEEPETKDGLGKNVKNSISKNFRVDGRLTGTVGKAPDTDWSVSTTRTDVVVIKHINGGTHMG